MDLEGWGALSLSHGETRRGWNITSHVMHGRGKNQSQGRVALGAGQTAESGHRIRGEALRFSRIADGVLGWSHRYPSLHPVRCLLSSLVVSNSAFQVPWPGKEVSPSTPGLYLLGIYFASSTGDARWGSTGSGFKEASCSGTWGEVGGLKSCLAVESKEPWEGSEAWGAGRGRATPWFGASGIGGSWRNEKAPGSRVKSFLRQMGFEMPFRVQEATSSSLIGEFWEGVGPEI